MIWASSVPSGSEDHSTPDRRRRSRPSASFMAIRDSHVARLEVAAKILKMRKRPDVGFLHDVLGLGVIAQDAAGEPVKSSIVRRDDGANRRLVAPKRAPDQFGVAAGGGNNLGGFCLAHDGSPSVSHVTTHGLDAAKPNRFPAGGRGIGFSRSRR